MTLQEQLVIAMDALAASTEQTRQDNDAVVALQARIAVIKPHLDLIGHIRDEMTQLGDATDAALLDVEAKIKPYLDQLEQLIAAA
jgi:uncharacterized ferritin-like protein (DUF455 family)